MNSTNIEAEVNKLLPKVFKPARYIGDEPYMVYKKQGEFDIRFAFCFPDTYEIGMSSMGLNLLYNIVNHTKSTYFERVFAPDMDMEELMRANNIPLFTLESKTAVKDCDIVGFTLQYELSYTNVINMLELAGLNFYAKDREECDPLVVAGGPCAFNVEPLADFFDIVMVGDGEDQLVDVCNCVAECKKNSLSKHDTLLKLSGIDGVYVPSFYEILYDEKGNYVSYKKTEETAPDKVVRAFLKDFESVDYPVCNIVPITEVVHDRACIELFRGCTRGCRFCQAGMLYRPVRERSFEKNIEIAKKQLENSGHSEISLLSLSTSDYSQFKELTDGLIPYCKKKQVGISFPSLRLDNFAFDVLDKVSGMRKTGLTFAVEAGTQRLRDVINKNVTEQDLVHTIREAVKRGYNSVKLYFMIGLPTETDEDLDGIVELCRKIIEVASEENNGYRGRFNISLSLSNFVPKPFTPFQWAAQDTPEEFERKHLYLKDKLRKVKGVTLHYHGSYTSALEAVFARGGRELAPVLLKAHEYGCKFDSWSEHFNQEGWEKALQECGIDADYFALKGMETGCAVPWEIIDCGIDNAYLLDEWNKAASAVTTKDCRYGCNGCGINKYTDCPLGGIYE